ncbi:MAG: ribosome-associated translation inhibitor RaiA, partial [Nitrospira sp.]
SMNIKIRAKGFDLTPAVEEYVNRKVSSLEKFLGMRDNILCEVEIGKTTNHHKSGDIFRAEVNIVEPGNGQIFAEAEEVDIYTAIDVVRDEAERAIVSRKTKRDTLVRRGGAVIKSLLKRIDIRRKS